MYNKVTLIGRLGKDPEIRSLDENTKVARITLATNESYKGKDGEWKDKTEWHNIVAWRGAADRAERQLRKGMLVFVDGKITYRKYQDKDGIERYVTDISAYIIKPLEKLEDAGSTGSSTQPPAFKEVEEKKEESSEQDTSNKEDDDLPF